MNNANLSVQGHSNFKWIGVTVFPYNDTEYDWGKVQAHLKGSWNNSALSIALVPPFTGKSLTGSLYEENYGCLCFLHYLR